MVMEFSKQDAMNAKSAEQIQAEREEEQLRMVMEASAKEAELHNLHGKNAELE